MDNPDLITTITRKNSILRYIQGIADQHLPIRIAASDAEDARVYRTQIARIEADSDQIVVHQPVPADWQNHIGREETLQVSCRMPNGTIHFRGSLQPLDGDANSPYCQLSLPSELNKKQLRSNFRVSVLKYDSSAVLDFADGGEETGSCQDISQGGVLVHLSDVDLDIDVSAQVEELRLHIPSILELQCAARVCRVKTTESGGLLLGLCFENLDPRQSNQLRSAIIKLERRNINN